MHWTELAGFATGALCVWLVVRRNIWTFPVGIANNVFFIILFLQVGGCMPTRGCRRSTSCWGRWAGGGGCAAAPTGPPW